MIASLRGTVIHKEENFLIVETGGIGYKVYSTPDVLASAGIDRDLTLFTHHQVSEDSQSLYGFVYLPDLRFFELLLSVSGIGPKVALVILSRSKREEIERAILREDRILLGQFPGVGKRIAERLIVELRDKIAPVGKTESSSGQSDVYSALLNLGYSRREAQSILAAVPKSALSPKEQLREALKLLGKKESSEY